jgi:hypothetical protein
MYSEPWAEMGHHFQWMTIKRAGRPQFHLPENVSRNVQEDILIQ